MQLKTCEILSAVALLTFVALPGCARHANSETVIVTGSSTIAPLAADVAREFERAHPGVRVDVQTGGSSRGLTDTRRGLAQIGMVSRALGPHEHDVVGFSVAIDGVCVITHRDNPINSLSKSQVQKIYTGAIEHWSEIGGAHQPITVVSKAAGRSTLAVFLQYVGCDSTDIDADVVIGDNEQGIKTVAGNPTAIGYVSVGAAESALARGVAIRIPSLDGVQPSTSTIRDGSHPIRRVLNLVTLTRPEGVTRQFIDYFRSEAAHELIARHYFVSVDPP